MKNKSHTKIKGQMEIKCLTDTGLQRDHNEDAIGIHEKYGLTILADGMGGENAGEVASSMAVEVVSKNLLKARRLAILKKLGKGANYELGLVEKAIVLANNKVFSHADQNPDCAGMGTTLVVGLHIADRLVVGHLGDSRMYRYRDGSLDQLTKDHSYVRELVDEGYISEEEAENSGHKNIVTRALGVSMDVDVEVSEYQVKARDIYLSCSDGLTDLVGDEDIKAIIMKLDHDLEAMASQLVEKANDEGGKDNISVILTRVVA